MSFVIILRNTHAYVIIVFVLYCKNIFLHDNIMAKNAN